MVMKDNPETALDALSKAFAALPEVRAVAVAGSQTASRRDAASDIDLYVYGMEEIPLPARHAIAAELGERVELDNRYWEPGDEWIHRASGLHIDIMYRSCEWMEAQLERVLVRHEASVGFSTCFWHNLLVSRVLFDRDGWLAELQAQARQPYPEALRRAIVAKNYPILRDTLSSYLYQLTSAISRGDRVSLNHRVAALLSSYFDILFAVNRRPHPGEKRLLVLAQEQCASRPEQMVSHVEALLTAAGGDGSAVLPAAHLLLDGLDALLRLEGLVAGNS